MNVRGLFLDSSCPNWPWSLLPHECTWPLPVKSNVCIDPHDISSMSADSAQSNSRGTRICLQDCSLNYLSLNAIKKLTCSSSIPPSPSSPWAVLPQQYNAIFVVFIYISTEKKQCQRTRFNRFQCMCTIFGNFFLLLFYCSMSHCRHHRHGHRLLENVLQISND